MKPARVALQNDGRYLWVGDESGVTVIDTSTLKVAAQLKTGAGQHEIAFTDDDRFAFVTNKQDGTLSVIDMRKLARVKDIKVGATPVAIAFSSLSKALYVASEDGTIAVVDGARLEILTRMKTQPGLRSLAFAARWPVWICAQSCCKCGVCIRLDFKQSDSLGTRWPGRRSDHVHETICLRSIEWQ